MVMSRVRAWLSLRLGVNLRECPRQTPGRFSPEHSNAPRGELRTCQQEAPKVGCSQWPSLVRDGGPGDTQRVSSSSCCE